MSQNHVRLVRREEGEEKVAQHLKVEKWIQEEETTWMD